MTQPLALVLYEKLLPGTQLVNRLEDLKYRVETLSDVGQLVERARQSKPMLVLVDLEFSGGAAFPALSRLRALEETAHLPIVGFTREVSQEIEAQARQSGVSLYVTESAIVNHLPEILQQALRVD